MTLRVLSLLFVLLLACPAPLWAAPEAAVDLSQDFIPVTEDFDGARLMIFGALRQPSSDIVVVLEGPEARALVRPKVRRFGFWVNEEALTVEDVPSFYAILSSRPVRRISGPTFLKKYGLSLAMMPPLGKVGEGLKENREVKGLYLQIEDGVLIRDRKLFRADIDLPPNVPIGTYKASIYEIAGGGLVASRTTNFKIEQTGIGGFIKNMAHFHPALYGFSCLALTLSLGALAARIFKKGGKK